MSEKIYRCPVCGHTFRGKLFTQLRKLCPNCGKIENARFEDVTQGIKDNQAMINAMMVEQQRGAMRRWKMSPDGRYYLGMR